ncbi:DUF4351 domain-containing protein [Methylomonas sp. LL1]|uniref:DUF4351 domain-containing protein n=1 Tax=Methylomonas sp. LL1 TaxID=2785785 RepID=UPI0018C44EFE|nr:DUF4351 domain-containing protein [Methylomonas sp. LL1]QPK62720.1 DUF4351 domain-containing protein [Methylomonas sp. LL1]
MDFLGVELKQTLFYQEIADEEQREGIKEESMTLLTRLLRRKFGLQPALETALEQLPSMETATLEGLADALLGFTDISDLQGWLGKR